MGPATLNRLSPASPRAPAKAHRARETLHLSKTRFTSGLQCHRLLWWTVNEPAAPELKTSPELAAVCDQGARVGELARNYIPGGELIDLPYWDMEGRVDSTRAAIGV